MKHYMTLYDAPFRRMDAGIKKFELRLYDEKRKKINLGDEIVFTHGEDETKKLTVKVIGLLLYKKFCDLIDDVPAALLGYKETEKEYLRASMYEIYSPKQEEQYGVLGIRIKKVS